MICKSLNQLDQVSQNKRKIINDPVFGFIGLESDIIFDLIEHPYFQRLRRIKQLGLSYLVFPGANHTRFEHALGAFHLLRQAIASLRQKSVEITEEEAEAAGIAILLHDIGHGPFSHVFENTLIGIGHEEASRYFMDDLNKQFNGKLGLALEIFDDKHPKKFLHQLISSQLDMDRLDYLSRDSFYTGVTEGLVGIDRIIKMLNVRNGNLVVDAKGIYNVEKFLIARRLMYWQVYLHKTVVAAEFLLISVLKRARELCIRGDDLFASPALKIFLLKNFTPEDFRSNVTTEGRTLLQEFARLDDNDILSAINQWQVHPDKVLTVLSDSISNRKLLKIKISEKPFPARELKAVRKIIVNHFGIKEAEASYFMLSGEISNNAYDKDSDRINILMKNDRIVEIRKASDINLSALARTVRKYFLCFPKELDIN